MAPKFAASPGSFTYTQTVPANFGEAYGRGIAAAGQSIGSAIGAVTGEVGKTMEQSQTTNDLLAQFGQMKGPDGNPIISQEDLKSIMGKSLGARSQFLGETLSNFHSQYQSYLDQQRQIAVARAQAAATAPYEMGRVAAQNAAEMARLKEEYRQKQLLLQQSPENRVVVPSTAATVSKGADKIVSPLAITLGAGKTQQDQTKLFGQ